jgi:hypothetical protein
LDIKLYLIDGEKKNITKVKNGVCLLAKYLYLNLGKILASTCAEVDPVTSFYIFNKLK